MNIPVPREEFLTTCVDLAKVVRLTSLKIVLPALYQMVDKDTQARHRPSSGSSSGSPRSSRPRTRYSFVEDDVDVMIMKNGVLSKIFRKRSVPSTPSLPKGQYSPSLRSQTSLVEFKSTAFCDQPETSFDLTEESLCLSVMQNLMDTLIERQSQSLSADLLDYASHVVAEVVASVFRALRTSGQNGVSAQETKEMLQQVSKRLCEYSAQQDAARAQISPAKDETLESTLACTARDTMDAVIQTVEDCLDDGDKFKPAKNILATLKKVVSVLACQSTSLEECKANAVIDSESRSLEQANVIESAQMLSNEEFHSKATLAVTDVLSVRGFHSTPSVNTRLTPSAAPVGDILENKPAICSRSAPVLSGSFPQTVDPATSILIETFVGEMKKIAQSYDAISCEGNSLKAGNIAAEVALDYEANVAGANQSSVLEAAVRVYHKVHTTMRGLFKQPLYYQSKGDVMLTKNDTCEQECQGLCSQGLPLSDQRDKSLSVAISEDSARLCEGNIEASQPIPALTEPQLDTCTTGVLRGFLASYFSGVKKQPLSSTASNPSQFLVRVLYQLDDLTSSSSASTLRSKDTLLSDCTTFISDNDECSTRTALEEACIEKLSSEEFQTKAFQAVSDVLLGSGGISHIPLQLNTSTSRACGIDLIKETGNITPESVDEAMPDNLSDNKPGVMLDSAASDLIGHFVDSVQKCEMELSALKSERRLSKENMTSAARGLYHSMHNKVRQMFAQWNCKGKRPEQEITLEDASTGGHAVVLGKMSQSENVVNSEASQPLEAITDTQGLGLDAEECTKEVMTEIVMVYKEQMAGVNSAEERYSVSSSLGSQLIDGIMSNLGEESVSRPGTPILEDIDDKDIDVTLPIAKIISSEDFERSATAKVSQVLLQSAERFDAAVESDDSKPTQDSLHRTTTLPTQSTASDIVTTVVRDIQKLFHSKPSRDDSDDAVRVLQGNKCAGSAATCSRSQPNDRVPHAEIWLTAQNMFQMLEKKLKDFYHLKMPTCIKTNQRTGTDAKTTVSKVLVTIQKGLSNSADFERSDELKLMWNIANSMIDHLDKMVDENGLVERNVSSEEPQRSQTPSSASSAAGPRCIAVGPIVRHTYIDMTDTGSDHHLACITQDTIVKVAEVIISKLGLAKEKSAASPTCDYHSSVPKRVERVLSSGSICHFSPSLTNEVYCLFLEGNKSTEAMALAAGKSPSDSILLKVGRAEKASRRDSTAQLIKTYSVESMKYLLLPLFQFSLHQSANQDKTLQPASASKSCPIVLHATTDEVPCQRASRSPLEILNETVTLISNVMVSDIMATSLSEKLEDSVQLPSLNAECLSLSSSSSSAVLEPPCEGQHDVTVTSLPPSPVNGDTEDYTSLVSLLVIRLLSQVKKQQHLSDDMLDMSRRLIDKALYNLDANTGISRNETCAHVKTHKVYRAIYKDLEKEFGSKELIDMDSQDPSFEETVVTSLTRALMRTRTPVVTVPSPAPNESEMEGRSNSTSSSPDDETQPRKGLLRFFGKIPKINLKKFKISVKKDSLKDAPSKDKTIETACTNAVSSGFSSEDKPRRRNVFARMFRALTKKSS